MSEHSNNNDPFDNEGSKPQRQVVYAEIVENDNSHNHSDDFVNGTFQQSNTGYEVHGRGCHEDGRQNQSLFGQARISCLPAGITLGLFLGVVWQAGFLAGIGFAFFYILGSCLALFVSVRRTLQRKSVFVWLNRILVWAIAYMLTLAVS